MNTCRTLITELSRSRAWLRWLRRYWCCISSDLCSTILVICRRKYEQYVIITSTSRLSLQMHTAISYNKTLQLPTSVLSQDFMGTCCEYELSSIVLHHGKLATGGHYTAVCHDRHANKARTSIGHVCIDGVVVVTLWWRGGGGGLWIIGVESLERSVRVSVH